MSGQNTPVAEKTKIEDNIVGNLQPAAPVVDGNIPNIRNEVLQDIHKRRHSTGHLDPTPLNFQQGGDPTAHDGACGSSYKNAGRDTTRFGSTTRGTHTRTTTI